MINNIKKYIQLFLSDSSFIYKTLKSFYLNFYNKKIFFPFNLADLNTDILKKENTIPLIITILLNLKKKI